MPLARLNARAAAALVALVCAFAPPTVALAQPVAAMRFRHLGVEDGLPSGSVSALLLDHEGYLWIGLHGGLCRYDGVRLESFVHDAADPRSLLSNMVTTLAEDRAGRLWVGTDRGVCILGPARDSFACVLPAALGGTAEDPEWITALVRDPAGDVWISSGSGLSRADAATGAIRRVRGAGPVPWWTILPEPGGRVWFGSATGLEEFDASTGTVRRRIERFGELAGRAAVGALHRDRAGRFWVGTIDGLIAYDPETGRARRFRPEAVHAPSDEASYVNAISEDENGLLWAATPAGALVVDPAAGTASLVEADPTGLRGLHSNQTTALAMAPGGVVFVGTRLGLDAVSRHANKFTVGRHDPLRPNSLRNDRVWSFLLGDDAMLWIGTTYGLDRLDLAHDHYLHATGTGPLGELLASEFIHPSLLDDGGTRWFGTWQSGLLRVAPDGSMERLAAASDGTVMPPVLALSRRRDGGVWVGTSRFLAVAESGTAAVRRVDLGPLRAKLDADGVTALLEDRRGRLWVGSAKGFYRVGADSALFTPSDRVTCFLAPGGDADEIVVGTSAGLEIRAAADPGRLRRRYGVAERLPSGVIEGILEERPGLLWVGTLRGLVRIDTGCDSVRVFDASDGMAGIECNQGACLRTASGEMFFGTNDGFVRFHPDSLGANTHVPPVVIRSLRAIERGGRRDSSCRPAGTLHFDHTWNSFAFECAALDFAMPERNRTAIKLEGYDDDWRLLPPGQHGEMYTNLDPGTYTLRVRGANGDGRWNMAGASVVLVIRPPFWETWWFRTAAVAALLVAVVSVSHARGRTIARRNVELERRVAERTEALDQSYRALREHKESLEAQVRERTRALEQTVATLQEEVASRSLVENELRVFQGALRRLASDLSRSEERERRRVAVFLHDVVGQTLFFCKMKLASLAGTTAHADLLRVHGLVEDLLNQVQSLTFELSPPVLYELGVEEAITRHINQMRKSHAVEIVFHRVDFPGTLSDEVRFVLFTATRELLANALKHASASRIDVEFGPWEQGGVRLVVRDDGAGFDSGRVPAAGAGTNGGFGLFHVRERLTYLGGSFDVASAVGRGTAVEVILPVDPGADGAPGTNVTHPGKGSL